MKSKTGYILALAGSVSFGVNMIFSKIALKELETFAFSLIFFAVAIIITFGYILFSGKHKMLRLDREDLLSVLPIGFFNAVGVIAFYAALKILDPTVAALLSRIELIITVLLGVIFLRERFNVKEMLGLAIVLIGVVVMNWQVPRAELRGFILITIGCVGFAVGWLFAARSMRNMDPDVMVFYRAVLVWIFIAAFIAATGRISPPTGYAGVLATILGALFGACLGTTLFSHAVQRIGISKSIVLNQIMPLSTAILSLVFLGTIPGLRQSIGGLIVMAGAIAIVANAPPKT
ncbi:MAG: DMT family transporter [Armatimonadota bacterium]